VSLLLRQILRPHRGSSCLQRSWLVVRLPSVLIGGSLVSFPRVECVPHVSALTALTLVLRPSRDLTGSPTRGEADSVHLTGWL
jgi:hypothetical protein